MKQIPFGLRALSGVGLVLLSACGGSGGGGSGGGSPAIQADWAAAQPQRGPLAPVGVTGLVELGMVGDDFQLAPGAALVERPDGTARLNGVLISQGDAARSVQMSINMIHRLAPGDADYATRAAPTTALDPSAYIENGGPVDPATWRYYEVSGGEVFGMGALRGLRAMIGGPIWPAVQAGLGANNLAVTEGAAFAVTLQVIDQPAEGAPLATDAVLIHFGLALDVQSRLLAGRPIPEVQYTTLPGNALTFPELGTLELVSGGTLTERSNGTARFEGVFARIDDATQRWQLELQLDERLDGGEAMPPTSPWQELSALAYRSGGGPIDTDAWRVYAQLSGRLLGMDALLGAEIELSEGDYAFQVGLGANGRNTRFGTAGTFALTVRTQPLTGPLLPATPGDGELHLTLGTTTITCADEALRDPQYSEVGGAAFWIPDLATDLVLVAGGLFIERADGTAELRGLVESASDSQKRFYAEVQFTTRIDPGQAGYPPAGSPKKELVPTAYLENGGPIDATTWHYYETTNGFLFGQGAYTGALIQLDRRGPAYQVGVGASNANLSYGASGWLTATVLVQAPNGPQLPTYALEGDINITLERGCKRCPSAAQADPAVYGGTSGHAFWLPGIGADFIMQPGSTFVERENGTAVISGAIVRASDPLQRFQVEVEFTERVDPGAASYPPDGSPKLELEPAAYLENGGPIDTNDWHYYLTTTGTLTGLDAFAGAELALTRMGPAFQVGLGASGKNLDFGASGWFVVEVLAQPTSGAELSIDHGDININVGDECP